MRGPSGIGDGELRVLLDGLRRVYGADFHGYAEPSLRRRLTQWLGAHGYPSLEAAHAGVLRERALFESLVQGITVNVTSMFRDPPVFRVLRDEVVPALAARAPLRLWVAGCASGEEAYSLAILLHEAGLAGRYRIYASDLSEAALARAREGIFPLRAVQEFTRHYQQSGGSRSFAEYYTARYGRAIIDAALKEHVVFLRHNLAGELGLPDMHFISCRNVMIYFKNSLKAQCAGTLDAALRPGGYLCLGSKESLPRVAGYDAVGARLGLYRKHDARTGHQ